MPHALSVACFDVPWTVLKIAGFCLRVAGARCQIPLRNICKTGQNLEIYFIAPELLWWCETSHSFLPFFGWKQALIDQKMSQTQYRLFYIVKSTPLKNIYPLDYREAELSSLSSLFVLPQSAPSEKLRENFISIHLWIDNKSFESCKARQKPKDTFFTHCITHFCIERNLNDYILYTLNWNHLNVQR